MMVRYVVNASFRMKPILIYTSCYLSYRRCLRMFTLLIMESLNRNNSNITTQLYSSILKEQLRRYTAMAIPSTLITVKA